MHAKRGRHHSAADGSRAAAWNRAARLAAIAALALALSACGGGAGSSSAAAATAQGSAPPQGSGPTQGAVPTGSAAAQGSAPAQSTAAAGDTTTAGSTSAASGTSAGSTSSAASSGSSTSGSSTVTSVTINWVPPTENTDGTWLTNLAGYNIHYGTASHTYTKTIAVSNPGVIRYVVENLTSGTYYFAVGAVNSTGTESPLSAEVRATVN